MVSVDDGSPTGVSRARGVSGQYPSAVSLSAVFQRSPQHCRGPTEESVLTSCATSPLLLTCQHHSALFSQQLLDLTHRWWSEAEGPTSMWVMSIPLRRRLICALNCTPRYPDPAPFQLPDPQQPARSLTDLLTTLAAILGRSQPHNVSASALRLRLCMKLWPKNIASWSQ